MSTQPKPQSYINIAADVNFLQRIICCNSNINNSPADTPKADDTVRKFNFADEIPKEIEKELDIEIITSPV